MSLISKCCRAPVSIALECCKDGQTNFFVCSECNRPTDAIQLPQGAEKLNRNKEQNDTHPKRDCLT
jgi:hypothetical protein